MRKPRLSLRMLMAVVGVIAVNLAAARALIALDVMLLCAVAVSGPALQAAAYGHWRSRGRARAFWLGVLAAGGLALAACLWAVAHPRSIGIAIQAGGSRFVRVEQPGSPLWNLLEAYTNAVTGGLARLGVLAPLVESGNDTVMYAITTVIWFVPQAAAAAVGGLVAALAWGIPFRGRRQLHGPPLTPPHASGLIGAVEGGNIKA